MIIGHKLIATPRYDIKKSAIDRKNDAASLPHPPSARHTSQAMDAVTIGTGANSTMFGQENQRAAIVGEAIGVQMLTMRIPARTTSRQVRPAPRAHSRRPPSVLMISQPAPSNP